ncbi:MAG: SsrA-binding protein SmpB [Acidobacteriota bacterium]
MEKVKILATNRQAHHNYFIHDRYEAGIALVGTEVKSSREGKINLKDSYAKLEDGELFLVNCHISPYFHGNIMNHDPLRKRKLLMHRGEIRRLEKNIIQAGFTLIPLQVYLKKGKIKIEMGLAKGKKLYDKREAKKRKDIDREMKREGRRPSR